MTIYALVRNGVVDNIIVAESLDDCPPGYDQYIADNSLSIGDFEDNGVWKKPNPVKNKKLSYAQYIDRVGITLFADILSLSKTDALTEAYMKRLEAAGNEINLEDPLHVLGWNHLIAQGVASEEDKDRVLS